ncbi:MAG: rhomboid family intramembrane serine protease [Muribaculaceae bacterium]|nr:rhomboid family intramembrane serine protease [Muribaculaceae bacterium]
MFNRSFFSNLPPVTKNLLILNILIWAFMAIAPQTTSMRVMNLGGLHYLTSPGFGIWQLFTYMFIHGNFTHLFFNMWALLMFGYVIEQTFGSKRFLLFYITCGLGAALVQMGVFAVMIHNVARGMNQAEYTYVLENGWDIIKQGYNYTVPAMGELNGLINGTTVGASGAIFGILLAFGMLYPNTNMFLFFIPYPIKAKWLVLGYGVLELCLGFGSPADGVAHFAHLGGMLFGFLMIWYWKKQAKQNGRF